MRRGVPLSILSALGVTAVLVAMAPSGASAEERTADASSDLIVSDDMDRTLAVGIGSAPTGGGYAVSDVRAISVRDGVARFSPSASGRSLIAQLPETAVEDSRSSLAFVVTKLPSVGRGIYGGVQLRRTGDAYYQVQARVSPRGQVLLEVLRVRGSTATQQVLARQFVNGVIAEPGIPLTIEAEISGTDPVSISARVSSDVDASADPAPDWQITIEDADSKRISGAGRVGIWTYVSTSTPAQAVGIDAFSVRGLTPQDVDSAPIPAPPVVDPPVVDPPVADPPVVDTPVADPPVVPGPEPTDPPAETPPTPAEPTPAEPTPAEPTPAEPTPAEPTPAPAPDPKPAPSPEAGMPPLPPDAGPSLTAPAPVWDRTGTRGGPGAAAVGSTRYPVPGDAIYVSAAAAPGGDGSVSAPFGAIQSAIDRARAGSTIVLRGGAYHESATIPKGKSLTIQSYPGEAAWLDGSERIATWSRTASGTWYAPWSHDFDSSPSYTKGAADGSAEAWRWIDPTYPLAAHPEQIWIDGVAQRQVGSLGALGAGTFFVDAGADRLYVGTNPGGHEVRAATETKALSIRAAGSTVRGIGVRGYANSVWMMGAVTVEASDVTLENVEAYDNATTAIYVMAAHATLDHVTAARNGLMGVGANYADGLVIDHLLSLENNAEHFNQAPVSGGLKLTRSRNVRVEHSAFLRNDGPGLWLDESVYGAVIAGNDSIENGGHGVSLELSQRIDFVNNVILRNAGNSVKINDTGGVEFWNNTVVGGSRAVNIVQDTRNPAVASTPGRDPRQPSPDPTVPWLIRDIRLGNNIIADSTGSCTLCVEDYSHRYSATSLNISSDANVLQRTAPSRPSWLVVWSRGPGNPATYTTLAAFSQATGQDRRSAAVDGRSVTTDNGALLDDVVTTSIAVTPPNAVRALLGTASNTVGAVGVRK